MSHQKSITLAALAAIAVLPATANASIIMFSGDAGLSGEAEFSLLDATTLQVRLRNTSTGVPSGFSNSDQLLTGISFDMGAPGANPGDPEIIGGLVMIGPDSETVNFDTGWYGPGTNVSGEFGYGNSAGSGHLQNQISSSSSATTPFGGPNLDGPVSLDGPQAGLIADPMLVPLGGLGAIRNEVLAIVMLSAPLDSLDFLASNNVRIEYGSDAAFVTTPAPGALSLLAAAACVRRRRRR